MKKNLLIIFISFAIGASAQNTGNTTSAISAGLELGIPANGIYSIGLAASAKGEIPVAEKISLTLSAGYSIFFYKSNLFQSSLTPSPADFVPIKAGVAYYFSHEAYLEGELGAAIETNYLKQAPFAFSVGPGFIIPTNNHGIDISFRYEQWSDHQVRQTAIRVAYRFGH